MKRILTGLQPSGTLHIGNYVGALKPFVELSHEYDSMLMVADYHALTTLKDPSELGSNILNIARDYMAAGIDLDKAVIFRQSDVQEHMELAWIFQCLVTVAFLERAHAYKDKVAKGIESNAGLFAYPMLMAADILLYDTDLVPVGADQRQHVEYAREAAAKFNNAFGDTFKEPQERIIEAIATVPGTDGRKMSKSYGNTIPLFGTKDEIAAAVMSIVTNSSADEEMRSEEMKNITDAGVRSGSFLLPLNLFRIHSIFKTKEELEDLYGKNQQNYKAIKEALIEDIEKLVAPMREKRDSISDDDVRAVLAKGGAVAKERAAAKMADVRKKIGISI